MCACFRVLHREVAVPPVVARDPLPPEHSGHEGRRLDSAQRNIDQILSQGSYSRRISILRNPRLEGGLGRSGVPDLRKQDRFSFVLTRQRLELLEWPFPGLPELVSVWRKLVAQGKIRMDPDQIDGIPEWHRGQAVPVRGVGDLAGVYLPDGRNDLAPLGLESSSFLIFDADGQQAPLPDPSAKRA